MSTQTGYRRRVVFGRVPEERAVWPPFIEDVVAAQNGDVRTLNQIMISCIPKLVAFYRGMGLQLHDAEDLASDTCEALVRSLRKLRKPERFEPWFWKVARSKFYDHLRRIKRPEQATDREAMYDDPSDALVVSDEHKLVREAFATLRVRDRELLWLRDVVGLAYADIAGRLSISEGAIRIAVMRARQRLETALEQAEGKPTSEGMSPQRRGV